MLLLAIPFMQASKAFLASLLLDPSFVAGIVAGVLAVICVPAVTNVTGASVAGVLFVPNNLTVAVCCCWPAVACFPAVVCGSAVAGVPAVSCVPANPGVNTVAHLRIDHSFNHLTILTSDR
jgi:hypothetical protein